MKRTRIPVVPAAVGLGGVLLLVLTLLSRLQPSGSDQRASQVSPAPAEGGKAARLEPPSGGDPSDVVGTVIDGSAGSPVPDAQVWLALLPLSPESKGKEPAEDLERSTSTDEAGRFRFARARSGFRPSHRVRVSAVAAGFMLREAFYGPAEFPASVKLTLARGATLAGKVMDGAHNPISGATIQCSPKVSGDVLRAGLAVEVASFPHAGGGAPQSATSGADGSFQIQGLRGGSWAVAARNDRGREVVYPEVLLADAESKTVNFLLPGVLFAVRGRVTDARGQAIGKETIAVVEARPPAGSGIDLARQWFVQASMLTGDDGGFELRDLEYGSVRLSLPGSRRYRLRKEFIDLIPGGTREVNLVAEERFVIRGSVTDGSTGAPPRVPRSDLLTIYAEPVAGGRLKVDSANIGADGRFELWMDGEQACRLKIVHHAPEQRFETSWHGPFQPPATDVRIEVRPLPK
jgi:hypothetical protein